MRIRVCWQLSAAGRAGCGHDSHGTPDAVFVRCATQSVAARRPCVCGRDLMPELLWVRPHAVQDPVMTQPDTLITIARKKYMGVEVRF